MAETTLPPRVARLRRRTLEAVPTLSLERARLVTRADKRYRPRGEGPLLRARIFAYLCRHMTIWIGEDELIVGQRGPAPWAAPTYPEICSHSAQDLDTIAARPTVGFSVSAADRRAQRDRIAPYWQDKALRRQIMDAMTPAWHACYGAGLFTEFMEQRAPGHTVADDTIYRRGMAGLLEDIAAAREALDPTAEDAAARQEQLSAMALCAGALCTLAERYALLADAMAAEEEDETRRAELRDIADVCRHVPRHPARTFREALQSYWFCHLAVITELNTWDSFSCGRLDQHLIPYYRRELAAGTLTREMARELLQCFFIQCHNQPAPPKVGVTLHESGTYTDFSAVNIGGVRPDGSSGVNEVSDLLLEVADSLRLVQPSTNVQLDPVHPDAFLRRACEVIRGGWGQPSLFNSRRVVDELVRQGKSVEDARRGGTSGCVEAGVFGKEAYILTGYLNLPKILELALHNGVDPRSGIRLGPETGEAAGFDTFEKLLAALNAQIEHVVDVKIAGNDVIEDLWARKLPAPFLSLLVGDCIQKGKDYHDGGARYNTRYIQGVGIATIADSLSAIRRRVYEDGALTLPALVAALKGDFEGAEPLRRRLMAAPRYGNDDPAADELMERVFEMFYTAVEGRPTARGGAYHIDMLPTTCHVYFGSVTGATADGRRAGQPLSEGISPVQGADTHGPTAVAASAGRMDHRRTGGTLLNQKICPALLATQQGMAGLMALIRGYFALGGHHIQFNVVDRQTLLEARDDPMSHRGLIVRVAGYSDYFAHLSPALQQEIIDRTEQTRF